MFGRRYFGGAFFGGRYFGDGGTGTPSGATAAQIWNYVLPWNGLPAGQTLAEIHSALTGSIDGVAGIRGALQVLLAVAAGQTRITDLGGGNAHVEFDAVNEGPLRVSAEMEGSERVSVTLSPDVESDPSEEGMDFLISGPPEGS